MKPISILSAAAVTAATVYVTWPAPASALPLKCKPLESRLSDAQKLAPIVQRNIPFMKADRDQSMTDKLQWDKVVDCIGHAVGHAGTVEQGEYELALSAIYSSHGDFDKLGCPSVVASLGVGSMSWDQLVERVRNSQEFAKKSQSAFEAANERLKDAQQDIVYYTRELSKCETREAERKAARHKTARQKASESRKPRKRQTARSQGDNNARPAGNNIPDTAATAAAIGFISGILNAPGVLNGRRGGGGGGDGVIGGASCHPYRDGTHPGQMDCSGH